MEPVLDDPNDYQTDTDQEREQTDTDRTDGDESNTPSQSRSSSVHPQEVDEGDVFDGYSFKGRHSVIIDDGEESESSGDESEEDVDVAGLQEIDVAQQEPGALEEALEDGAEPKTPEARPAALPEAVDEPPTPPPKPETPTETTTKTRKSKDLPTPRFVEDVPKTQTRINRQHVLLELIGGERNQAYRHSISICLIQLTKIQRRPEWTMMMKMLIGTSLKLSMVKSVTVSKEQAYSPVVLWIDTNSLSSEKPPPLPPERTPGPSLDYLTLLLQRQSRRSRRAPLRNVDALP